jgi:hypothetical protein
LSAAQGLPRPPMIWAHLADVAASHVAHVCSTEASPLLAGLHVSRDQLRREVRPPMFFSFINENFKQFLVNNTCQVVIVNNTCQVTTWQVLFTRNYADYSMYSTFLTASPGSVLFSRSTLLKRKDLCFSCLRLGLIRHRRSLRSSHHSSQVSPRFFVDLLRFRDRSSKVEI